MYASMRPYATAGVALVGASVIAVSPIAPSQPGARIASPAVSLAASSVANIPANLINAFLNMPAASVAGIERFAAALAASGSWNESQPNNVWGWDPANPEHAKGLTDMTLPFPALSRPLGEQLNWFMAANFPMYAGCAFTCPDPIGMLNGMFGVPMWEFYDEDGYTFGQVINPVDGKPTEWSEQTVKLDPLEPIKSVINYLLDDPGEVTFPTAYEVITAVADLARALQITGHLASWIAVDDIETFLKLFVPAPAASSAPQLDFTQISTLDVDTLRVPDSEVTQNQDLAQAVAGATTTADSPEAGDAGGGLTTSKKLPETSKLFAEIPVAGEVVEAVSLSEIDQSGGELGTESPTGLSGTSEVADTDEESDPTSKPVEKPKPNASSDVATDGNKAEPSQVGGRHRKPDGGLSGAVKSVTDQISSSISRVTDGFKRDGAKTDASGGAKTDAASGAGAGADRGAGGATG